LQASKLEIALLTGGSDKPYALGLAATLDAQSIKTDFIGSDELDCPEVRQLRLISFLNLRQDQSERATLLRKVVRIIRYYARLMWYAAVSEPPIFHILWNNKFEVFDRSLLMLYYRALGKRVVLTAHNVNRAKRDSRDSVINRVSLRIQYALCHHVFVHTPLMKDELVGDFGVPATKVTVIPFGLNDTNVSTDMTSRDARGKLGIRDDEKVLLFFGQIAPYKGLEHLVAAVAQLKAAGKSARLIVAGKVKQGSEDYWDRIERLIDRTGLASSTIRRIQFIPDDDVEIYFKAADALMLPYVDVFQSGVLVLAYNFGLPVLATNVGSINVHVVEGETGFVCRPGDPPALADMIDRYYSSTLFTQLSERRGNIRRFARERYSWAEVGKITRNVYERLLAGS